MEEVILRIRRQWVAEEGRIGDMGSIISRCRVPLVAGTTRATKIAMRRVT